MTMSMTMMMMNTSRHSPCSTSRPHMVIAISYPICLALFPTLALRSLHGCPFSKAACNHEGCCRLSGFHFGQRSMTDLSQVPGSSGWSSPDLSRLARPNPSFAFHLHSAASFQHRRLRVVLAYTQPAVHGLLHALYGAAHGLFLNLLHQSSPALLHP